MVNHRRKKNYPSTLVRYTGGLSNETKSNLSNAAISCETRVKCVLMISLTACKELVFFMLLSSDPNEAVERFAGITNAYRESSALPIELQQIGQLPKAEFEKGMDFFSK